MTMIEEQTKRVTVPELEEILGVQFPVLDKGFVRVVDYMGSDAAIVRSARVSYGKGTKTVREDRGLIRYLIRNRHTTPLEQCKITLHVRVPMDAWRQWIRHRMASVNEYSTRYSLAIDDRQVVDTWRVQSKKNKQGSSGVLPEEDALVLSAREEALHQFAQEVYDQRIEMGVAREQARKDLPLSTYTEAYWTIDLHNLMHFLSLRMDSHAQQEIREYANVIGHEFVSRWVPHAWEAFCDYRLNGAHLSGSEVAILRQLIDWYEVEMPWDNDPETCEIRAEMEKLSKREVQELANKLGLY